ncbi:MAG: CapA family protein [Actinobacteria bacterium]|nr:CapA family protein [Actinomycetota bacterium]
MPHRRVTTAAAAAVLAAIAAAASVVAVPAARGGAEPRSFTLAATGDILVTETVRRVADAHAPGAGVHDFTPMLEAIEPWIEPADLAICHLETPLLPPRSGIRKAPTGLPFPQYSAPADLAAALVAAGYDACSTAANHALDYGFDGLAATLDTLDAAGIGHSGTARSAEEDHPALYDVNGVLVAHGAYTFGTNKIFVDDEWAVDYLDLDAMLADAAWARAQGAEFVVFSIHWGKDYTVLPSERQLEHAGPLMESPDIDLILGHHAHVVQPVDVINGKVVVYGMGNHISNIRSYVGVAGAGSEDGVVTHVEVTEQPDGSFAVTGLEFTPTRVLPETMQVIAVEDAIARRPGWRDRELRGSLALTVARLSALGADVRTTATPWPGISCRGRFATVLGTAGDDVLVGTDGDDVIVGREGDDTVWAGDGDDLACLGGGDDFASGGGGHDVVFGGDGDDVVFGGDGDDLLWGGAGADLLSGFGGDDLVIGEAGDDALVGGPGDDLLWGGSGTNRADGSDGSDGCRAAATITACER